MVVVVVQVHYSGVVNWESYQSLSLDYDESDSPDPDNKI